MIYRQNINPFTALIGILLLFVFVYGAIYLAWGVFRLLMYIAPLFLIAALFINYRVYVSLWLTITGKFRRNFLSGISFLLLLIVGFPVVSAYLFLKAILTRKMEKMRERFETGTKNGYSRFEEVSAQPKAEETKIFISRQAEARLNTGYAEDIDFEEEK